MADVGLHLRATKHTKLGSRVIKAYPTRTCHPSLRQQCANFTKAAIHFIQEGNGLMSPNTMFFESGAILPLGTSEAMACMCHSVSCFWLIIVLSELVAMLPPSFLQLP